MKELIIFNPENEKPIRFGYQPDPVDKKPNPPSTGSNVTRPDFMKQCLCEPRKKPPFNADDAEEFIVSRLKDAYSRKNEVFRKDNMNRDRYDFVYSDEYYRLLGEEIAYRKILDYFAQFEL